MSKVWAKMYKTNLKTLLRHRKTLPLYGIKYTNDRQENTKTLKVPTEYILLENIDIEKETLFCVST